MEWRVPLADLDYGREEEEAVLNVLRSKWLTMGGVTQQFEVEFTRMSGAKFAFAVSNATEALHLACLALGEAATGHAPIRGGYARAGNDPGKCRLSSPSSSSARGPITRRDSGPWRSG